MRGRAMVVGRRALEGKVEVPGHGVRAEAVVDHEVGGDVAVALQHGPEVVLTTVAPGRGGREIAVKAVCTRCRDEPPRRRDHGQPRQLVDERGQRG